MQVIDRIEVNEIKELKNSLDLFKQLVDKFKNDFESRIRDLNQTELQTFEGKIDHLRKRCVDATNEIKSGFGMVKRIEDFNSQNSNDIVELSKKVYEAVCEYNKIDLKITSDKAQASNTKAKLSMERLYQTPRKLTEALRKLLINNKIRLKDFLNYYGKGKSSDLYRRLFSITVRWQDVDDERRKRLEFIYDFLNNQINCKKVIGIIKKRCLKNGYKSSFRLTTIKKPAATTTVTQQETPKLKKELNESVNTRAAVKRKSLPASLSDIEIVSDSENSINIQRYVYDIRGIDIKNKVNLVDLINRLRDDLKSKKISYMSFAINILNSTKSSFGYWYDLTKKNWEDLTDYQQEGFALIYMWLNDEDRVEKICMKDPTVIERLSTNQLNLSFITKLKPRQSIIEKKNEAKTPVTSPDLSSGSSSCIDADDVDVEEMKRITTPCELGMKLKRVLDENRVDNKLFAKNVFNFNDKQLRSFKKLMNEDRKWKELSPKLILNYKILYKWLKDEKNIEEFKGTRSKDENIEDDTIVKNENNNNNNDVTLVDTPTIEYEYDTIKVEYDDSIEYI